MIVSEHVITCCDKDCGISFAVPDWWWQGKQSTRSTFYCPNGHGQHFIGETEANKMRRERDIAFQNLAYAEERAEANAKAAKKARLQVTKLQKRAAAGTCPCCQRSFSNMAEHMKRQHPGFVEGTGAKVVPIKVGK